MRRLAESIRLAGAFVAVALVSVVLISMLAAGYLKLGSEWPGLLVGALLIGLFWAALRRP